MLNIKRGTVKITNRIRFYREQTKLTQKELAEKTNITERNIQRIESGVQDPKISTVLKITNVLETTVEKLFKLGGENSSSEKQFTTK